MTPQIVAVLLLVLFCFAAGLFARTPVAKRIGATLETKVLANLPGYELIKSMSENLAGVDTSGVRDSVMARIEDVWQIAFVVDRLDDGHLAIYVPGVPEIADVATHGRRLEGAVTRRNRLIGMIGTELV